MARNAAAPMMTMNAAANEALSCFEMLRTAGFLAEELFFSCDDAPEGAALRVQVRQNSRVAILEIARVAVTPEALHDHLHTATVAYNSMPPEKSQRWLREVYLHSNAVSFAVEILYVLAAQGVVVRGPNDEKAKGGDA